MTEELTDQSGRWRAAYVVVAAVTLAIGAVACSVSDTQGANPTTALGTTPSTDDQPGTTATLPATTGTEAIPSSTGGSLTEREAAYADAVVVASAAGQNFFSADEAACIAPRLVVLVGADNLDALGMTPEDVASGDRHLNERRVDRATAVEMVDALVDCGFDLVDGFVKQAFPEGATPVARACIVATVDEDDVRVYLESAWSGGDIGEVYPDIVRCR